MTDRTLASVQTISDLTPIDGADSIERAQVMGWGVVVKKGEFTVGQACVFFEIDSVLPVHEWAEFMRQRKFRVRTIKLRGCLSQGLAMPLNVFQHAGLYDMSNGEDVTDLLGVAKYELPAKEQQRQKDIEGVFPSFIPKTDEPRLQSAMGLLDELYGHPYYITEKVDGTSCTIVKLDGKFTVASRNWALKEGNNWYWQVAKRYGLAEKLPDGYAIQGEVCGPGIQKNRLGLDAVDLRVFNVFDIKAGQFLAWTNMVLWCRGLGLPTVREILAGIAFNANHTRNLGLSGLLRLADDCYPGTENPREGIVVRPTMPMTSETLGGGRLSFKVLNNDFLLKDKS